MVEAKVIGVIGGNISDHGCFAGGDSEELLAALKTNTQKFILLAFGFNL